MFGAISCNTNLVKLALSGDDISTKRFNKAQKVALDIIRNIEFI